MRYAALSTPARWLFFLAVSLLLNPLVSGQDTAAATSGEAMRSVAAPAFSGLEEMTPEQQLAMQAYRSVEMENLINQLFKLEGRMSGMEQGARAARESIERVAVLDSLRQVAEVRLLGEAYQRDLTESTQLLESIDSLRKLCDWPNFVGDARALADPATYDNFTQELALLQEEQKNSLRLPGIQRFDNPYFTSIYALTAALGSKDGEEERAKIQPLITVLDFAMRADRELDYIATEVAFAGEMGEALYARASALHHDLYALVNLEPGKLDDARRKFFQYQFSADFIREHRDKITAYQRETDRIREEYGYYQFTLATALRKASFGLDRLRAEGTGEEKSALAETLEARKAALRERIEAAAATVARHRGGNG